MSALWHRTQVPRLVAAVAAEHPPPMPVVARCAKCGETDVDGFLDANCLSSDDWHDLLDEHGVVVGTTLFRVASHGRDAAVCAACIRANSWGAKALQRGLAVDLLTQALAGVPLASLAVAWAAPCRRALPPATCPNSLRPVDECTGWCDFCAAVCFRHGVPCAQRPASPPATVALAARTGVATLTSMCRWAVSTGDHAAVAGLAMPPPHKLAGCASSGTAVCGAQ